MRSASHTSTHPSIFAVSSPTGILFRFRNNNTNFCGKDMATHRIRRSFRFASEAKAEINSRGVKNDSGRKAEALDSDTRLHAARIGATDRTWSMHVPDSGIQSCPEEGGATRGKSCGPAAKQGSHAADGKRTAGRNHDYRRILRSDE